MFESGYFWREIELSAQTYSCKWAIFARKIEIGWKIVWKIEIFKKFLWKNRNFAKIYLEKVESFGKLSHEIEISRKFAWKTEMFLTRIHDPQIHDPQISNQIDAAESFSIVGLEGTLVNGLTISGY